MARLLKTSIRDLHQQLNALQLRAERLESLVKPNPFDISELEKVNLEIKRVKTMLILKGEKT